MLLIEHTHFFLAIPLKREVKNYLRKNCDMIKEKSRFKTWVHPDDYHITLAFLGNSPLEKLNLLKEKLPSVIIKHSPFQLKLSTLGTFGKQDSPRILWWGISDSDSLVELQKAVYRTCREVGFSLDKKPFKAHITLARRWIGETEFHLKENESMLFEEDIVWNVDNITLYQTHMKRTPKYETKEVFWLRD